MRDFDERHKACFGTISVENTLERVRVALDSLWKENNKRGIDKVAGDFTYEELISALLHAEASEVARRELEEQYDRLVVKYNSK